MGITSLLEDPVPDGMHELAVMDPTGDTKTIWDPNNADEVEEARGTFDRLKAKGFAAFKVEGPKGEKGEIIREFDPTAGRMIMIPALAGG